MTKLLQDAEIKTTQLFQDSEETVINQIFPASVLSVSREEFGRKEDNPDAQGDPLKLKVKDGTLPLDLQGHVFIIGATGSVDSSSTITLNGNSAVLPSDDGTTPLYNGDGMVYRVDFDQLETGVFLSTRLVKTPCYYADVATNKCKQYQGSVNPKKPDLRFKNLGITRVSGPLGTRNQLNTAFLPMKFSEQENTRLLATWDVGRPYEIDPKTLETVTPVGKNSEWSEANKVSQIFLKPTTPFKTIQSSAHPCFDPYTKEMFTVNVGRSFITVLSQFFPLFYTIKSLFHDFFIKNNTNEKDELLYNSKYLAFILKMIKNSSFLKKCKKYLLECPEKIFFLFEFIIGNFLYNFVYLIKWDGSGELQKWKVIYNGCNIKIKQSTHQIGLTEDYVILIDTAFKISLGEILPSLEKEGYKTIEKFLRKLFVQPQLNDNSVYIICRSDLQKGKKYVKAKKINISGEAAHFLVDYRNPNQQITLHLAHVCAWDAAEWLTEFDCNNTTTNQLQRLYGAIAGPMDISRLGCHVINANTGEFIRKNQDIVMDVDYTWGAAIYAYQDYPLPDQLEDIYWSCLGCWGNLKTPHITHLYEHYKYRQVGLQLMDEITKKGKPSSLLRVHIEHLESVQENENRLSIPDGYQFPDGHWAVSPQFIPRSETRSSTDGYIICIVHYGDGNDETNGNELWIFDAADLNSGPKCKLWHEQFNVGFTIHTAWLPKVEKRNAQYFVDTQEDYQEVLQQQSLKNRELIEDLFNNWVYPKREPKQPN